MTAPLVAAGCALTVVGLVAGWLRRAYAVVRVTGDSMAPALADGERLLARRVPPSALRGGQVVVVRSPLPVGGRFLIKRIAALPGDPVPASVRSSVQDDHVPDGRLVLLGDNTKASYDSREHGYFAVADIHARTLRKLSPRTMSPERKEAGQTANPSARPRTAP